MYEYINGKIAELTPTYVIVEAAGVGFLLNVSLQTYTAIEKATEAKIFTHYIVREDAQILYGFATKQEREVFRLLISVSGVGGNTARMILSTYSPDELSSIISTDNATLLKNVKGLGLKTSQKIIVELRDKMLGIAFDTLGGTTVSSIGVSSELFGEALAALTMLGFTKGASEKSIKTIIKENPTANVEEVIRLSLKKL